MTALAGMTAFAGMTATANRAGIRGLPCPHRPPPYLPLMIKILHNDTCPICSREVAVYARQADRAGVTLQIDGLDQAPEWDLDPDTAAQSFRVDHDGQRLEGLDAFRLLWSKLPGWRWLARITGLPGVHWLADRVYRHAAAPVLYTLHRRRQRRLEFGIGQR